MKYSLPLSERVETVSVVEEALMVKLGEGREGWEMMGKHKLKVSQEYRGLRTRGNAYTQYLVKNNPPHKPSSLLK